MMIDDLNKIKITGKVKDSVIPRIIIGGVEFLYNVENSAYVTKTDFDTLAAAAWFTLLANDDDHGVYHEQAAANAAAATAAVTAAVTAADIPGKVASEMAAFALAIQNVTATGAVTKGNSIVLVDATTAAVTLTLPAAAVCDGQKVVVQKTDAVVANALTIAPATGTINGLANVAVTAEYATKTFYSDGTKWIMVA